MILTPLVINWNSDTVVASLTGAVVAGVFVLANTLLTYWKEKQKQRPDLHDVDYSDLIKPITDQIQKEIGAYRVAYWAAQNGEKTLDGYSIKKLSMVTESNAEGVDNVITEMQNIPVVAFKRNLDKLRKVESFIFTKEWQYEDQLGKTHRAYGIQESYFFKANNLKRNMWTGILVVAFEDKNAELDDSQIGWLQFQVNRIEGIISQL